MTEKTATTLNPSESRKLADAAEPGPWHVEEHPMPDDHPGGWPLIVVKAANGREVVAVIEDDVASASEHPRENAEFIAHARTALPEALGEIARLRAELDAIGDLAYRANPAAGGDALDAIHARAKRAAGGDDRG